MRKRIFIILFITVHLFFIVFPIYKQSKMIELLYRKQKYEKLKSELYQQKQSLKQRLYAYYNHKEIAEFAQQVLQMRKLVATDIKTLKI